MQPHSLSLLLPLSPPPPTSLIRYFKYCKYTNSKKIEYNILSCHTYEGITSTSVIIICLSKSTLWTMLHQIL